VGYKSHGVAGNGEAGVVRGEAGAGSGEAGAGSGEAGAGIGEASAGSGELSIDERSGKQGRQQRKMEMIASMELIMRVDSQKIDKDVMAGRTTSQSPVLAAERSNRQEV
jgi:hypothetical protein